MTFAPKTLFSVLVLIFFGYLVWEAREWRLQARLFPWSIGIPMIVLAVINIIQELRGVKKESANGSAPADFQFTQGLDRAVTVRRTLNIFSWIFGFLASLWVLGFSITIAAVTFCYLKIQSKEGWGMSLILTAGAWLIYWVLFERTLRLPFPEGQIFRWLGW